ncbi:MAG: serine/threonine-protein kinase [Planctomycetota bacterium]
MNAPREVGGFLLEAELGRGGMGVVYRARDPRLGRPVALKVILGDASPQELRRFQTEAAASAQLDHPNLVRVLSAGEAHGRPWLALEFVPGETLGSRLKREGPLPPPDAARLVAQLARGLAHAHTRGVIHRDIKPDNVLLHDGVPRLTDFGLARFGERHLTQTGAVLGTPAYMAPEQAAGEASRVGPAADAYALGALLYALLSGRPPFRGTSTLNTIRQVLDDPPPRLVDAPRALEQIALRALAKDPAERPSAAQLGEALEAWLRGASAPQPRHGPRWPLALAAASSLAAAGAIGFVLVSRAAPTPTAAAPPDDPREGDDARATSLATDVAQAREAYAYSRAAELLEHAAGEFEPPLPLPLEFERLALGVQRRHPDFDALYALARRAQGPLAARSQALLALAAVQRARWEDAEVAEQAALRGGGEDPEVLRLLARAALQRSSLTRAAGLHEHALELFRRARAAGDDHEETALRLYASDKPPPERRIETLRELASRYLGPLSYHALAAELAYRQKHADQLEQAEREWNQGLEWAERAVEVAPDDPEVLVSAGNLYTGWLQFHRSVDPAKLGRAQELLERGLTLAPDDPLLRQSCAYAWRLIAEELLRQRRTQDGQRLLERAQQLLRESLARYPGTYLLRRELADCTLVREGPGAALAALAPLLRAHPEQGELHYMRYRYLALGGDSQGALAAIEEAARLEPERFQAVRETFLRQLGR